MALKFSHDAMNQLEKVQWDGAKECFLLLANMLELGLINFNFDHGPIYQCKNDTVEFAFRIGPVPFEMVKFYLETDVAELMERRADVLMQEAGRLLKEGGRPDGYERSQNQSGAGPVRKEVIGARPDAEQPAQAGTGARTGDDSKDA